MITKKIKKIEHIVYDDIEEFKKNNPNKTVNPNWRKAREGEWVIADDKGVVQILKKAQLKHPNDSKNYKNAKGYVRTVVGTFVVKDNSTMDTDFSKHPNRYTFSRVIKNPNANIKNREYTTKKERAFSANIISGRGVAKAYMDAFEETNQTKARRKGLVLLKQERVVKEVEKGALDVAKKLGIDHNYILRGLKTLCDNSEDENIRLQTIKELGKIVGTIGGTSIKQKEMGVFGMFEGFAPDTIETAKREIIPEKTSKGE
tara:strand:+ start:1088 stop:1864 length:777 start_codon:yes stop_codon:yes gene_type:complete